MRLSGTKWLGIGYGALIYSFLYIPIVVLVIFSFNDSKINAVWKGFTLDWYKKLWSNQQILDAFQTSMLVAFISCLAATVIATLTAMALTKYHFRGKQSLDMLLYLSMVIPEIVMGVAFLAFFALIGIPLGIFTLVIAHITFCIPFVVVVIRARLEGFDRSIEEAAQDLGANSWQTFRHITLPLISPGIIAGALLAFTISLDDVIVSFFVAGPGSTTLPLQIYSMVRLGVSPEINALTTILLFLTCIIVLVSERLRSKGLSKNDN